MKFRQIILTLVLGFLFWGILSTSGNAQTIRLIIVGDPGDFDGGAREGINIDIENVKDFFKTNVSKNNLEIIVVSGEKATPNGIRQAIAELSVQPDDVVVFYYSGHAASETEDGGQYFHLIDENGEFLKMPRRETLDLLRQKNARFIVLLSDCCNVFLPPSKDFPPPGIESGAKFSPIVQKLFIEQEGILDATSSKLGQYSLATSRGSIGTLAFLETLEEIDDESRAAPDRPLRWSDVIPRVQARANEIFFEEYGSKGPKGQTSQDFYVFQYPDQQRFGARVCNSEESVVVTEIVPDSPAEASGLKIDDVILKINDEKITDEASYSKAIDESPDDATLFVRRDGVPITLEAKMPPVVRRSESENVADLESVSGRSDAIQAGAIDLNDSDPSAETAKRTDAPSGPVFGASVKGGLVTKVVPDSPAARAGIEVNDRILKFNDVVIRRSDDFGRAVDESGSNATLIVNKYRTRKNETVVVRLNKKEEAVPDFEPLLETAVAEIDEADAEIVPNKSTRNESQPVFGAAVSVENSVVRSIKPGSPADRAGLRPGDQIVRFNDQIIKTGNDFANAVDSSPRQATLIVIDGDSGKERTVGVTLNK